MMFVLIVWLVVALALAIVWALIFRAQAIAWRRLAIEGNDGWQRTLEEWQRADTLRKHTNEMLQGMRARRERYRP